MQIGRRLAIGAALVFTAGLGHAAQQTLLGTSFLAKNPSTPDKRKVTGKAKEPGSPNSLVGTPVTLGAVLILTASGGSPTTQSFVLPAGNSVITGKPFWSGDTVKGFRYKDPKGENGPVKTVKIRKTTGGTFSLKAVAVGKLGTVLVIPPNPGTSACVQLQLGGGDSYVVEFGPTSRITNKGPTLFKAKKPTVEGNCGSTTTLVTTTTTSSTTSTTLYGSPSRAFVDRVMSLLD